MSALKEFLQDALGPFYEPCYRIFWILWPENLISDSLLNSAEETYWLYLLSFVVVALGIYLWQHSSIRSFSFTNFFKFLVPSSVYGHKSAIVDYKYYLPNYLFDHYFGFGVLIITTPLVGGYCKSLLLQTLGPMDSPLINGLPARLIYTALLIVALDAGYFVAHYLEHRIPFLWEFHKTHHSAEVLTPLTVYRIHPMDIILQAALMTLGAGTVTGITAYFCGDVLELTILSISAIGFVHFLTANLRHSHVWLSFGWALSHVFSSPAMHQIHHSTAARHLDKNFGLIFSFYDYLASTLYVPRMQEDLTFGLATGEHTEYSSVWTLYVLPIQKPIRLMISAILFRFTSPSVVQSLPGKCFLIAPDVTAARSPLTTAVSESDTRDH